MKKALDFLSRPIGTDDDTPTGCVILLLGMAGLVALAVILFLVWICKLLFELIF